jgi:antitoxin (DNA-binding transcriptional repressor) of toxin-antitoxin stability system
MGKKVSATEAVRKFSDLLNSIKYRGDRYTIIKGGKPVAFIGPLETSFKGKKMGDLKDLVERLPRLGREAEKFKEDLVQILKQQPKMPEKIHGRAV